MFNFLSKVSLTSWDEAWYGEIAKNIYNSGDIFNLVYNQRPFFDHPPFVMWLQALSYYLFGINEFSVRFPSFVLGLGTLFVLYLLGKELFSKTAGLFASLALVTTPWFLTRSLSGNLDIPLTFLFVLSFYLTIKSSINRKFLIPLSISLSFLFLTKSLVPFTILPVLAFVLWKKVKLQDLIKPTIIFLAITIPWFVINVYKNSGFIDRYLSIGYPGDKTATNILENIMLTKTYLHNGIGNWFYYGFSAILIGTIFNRKKFLPITVFAAVFLFPFMFSNKGHIWHLIPLYPFWLLSFFGLVEILIKNKYLKFIAMFTLFILISLNQMKRNWYEILMAPIYTSDIKILSIKSQEYSERLYLDDDAIPETLFYSNKGKVERTFGRGDLRKKFDEQNDFLLITRDWRLEEEKIKKVEYTLIAKDRDKVLILKK